MLERQNASTTPGSYLIDRDEISRVHGSSGGIKTGIEIGRASGIPEALPIRTAAGVDPAAPGLKDVDYLCCSILLAVKLEQVVRCQSSDSYLR